jgi:hypothetical protein
MRETTQKTHESGDRLEVGDEVSILALGYEVVIHCERTASRGPQAQTLDQTIAAS